MHITSSLPSLINERIIVKMIDTIQATIKRTRRTIGLLTCLEVLLQSHVQTLNLSGLFFQVNIFLIITLLRKIEFNYIFS